MKTQVWMLAGIPMIIAGCSSGGGGSSGGGTAVSPGPVAEPRVVSTTTQVTPLPASYSPGLTSGTYDAIALVASGGGGDRVFDPVAEPGVVQIQVDAARKSYTLLVDVPGLPAATSFVGSNPNYGTHVEETYRWSDGRISSAGGDQYAFSHELMRKDTVPPYSEEVTLEYYLSNGVEPSNVAIGKMTRNQLKAVTQGQQVEHQWDQLLNEIYFVHGFRTAPTDVPVSGTASYSAVNPFLSSTSNGEPFLNGDFLLTADFGKATISASLNWESYSDYEYSAWGIEASGSAPFASNGGFTIPMAGKVTTNYEPVVTDQPISGSIQGAFFGPQAQQVGGVFEFATPDNSINAAGAFIGGRISE